MLELYEPHIEDLWFKEKMVGCDRMKVQNSKLHLIMIQHKEAREYNESCFFR